VAATTAAPCNLVSLDRRQEMVWQVQEAKQKFSQLVRQAIEQGPQVVTRHGEEAVVVISAAEYRRLTGRQFDVKAFLLAGPDLGALDLERKAEMPRDVDL
jgi:prevent-host-death family protein